MDEDSTHLGNPAEAGRSPSGWLGTSDAIDHGRFPTGTVLDSRYRITGLLGRGGMGEVYRADDLRLGQIVALKFLPAGLAADARRLAQLHREVRTARQVAHPNVCRVYDIVEADGHLFLTMEHVDGEDLAASLRRIGRFPEDKAIDIARQICAGLAAVHERGIVLRDLKPANLMLDAAGKVRLMDFGLAAAGEIENVREGTPAYMAPEQIDGREATRRSDIYALGLVLYEIFTGRRAFEAASLADLVLQQSSGDITPPTALVKHLDPSIERAILRCLEREPERRPSSAIAVAASMPGGDPLAAAVAAGEIPSPELVAAAGAEQASLTVRAGLAWLSLMLAALVGLAIAWPHFDDLSQLPVEKPRAALEDHALDIVAALGGRGSVGDTVSGFAYDGGYLNWLEARLGTDRREQLRRGRPAPMRFWLRTSPQTLVPIGYVAMGTDESIVVLGNDPNPPLTTGGMTVVELDLSGRLNRFVAVPAARDGPDATRRVTDWEPAFRLADLDPKRFHEVPSTWTPAVSSDERRAWQGTIPELPDTPLTIEGAASHGAIVQFSLLGPWSRPAHDDGVVGPPWGAYVPGLFVCGLFVGAAIWAWRNYTNGRGDRRGARRAALVVMLLSAALWAVAEGHIHGLEEISRAFFGAGSEILLIGAVSYALYLAVEPFVRRIWPHSLIVWSRLISGRYRDSLVGRDLLIGIAVGVALEALLNVPLFGSLAMHGPGAKYAGPHQAILLGWHGAWWVVIFAIRVAVIRGLFLLFLVTAARWALRRAWLALLVVAVILLGLNLVPALLTGSWFSAIKRALHDVVLIVILGRLGLVALCATEFAYTMMDSVSFSLRWSLPHVANSWPPVLFLVALALLGFWMATSAGARTRGSGSPSRWSPTTAP